MAHEVLYKGPGSTESDMPAGTEEDDLFDCDGLSKLKPVNPQTVRKIIPRYLYRAYSSSGPGEHCPQYFRSATALRNPDGPGFFDLDPKRGQCMLRKHLKGDHFPGNDLFSLTSLFRIALQRATVMVREFKKDVHICIIDTQKVGLATVFPATVLMDNFFLNPNTVLEKVSATEYVAHGMLDVSRGSSSASLKSLIENGLCDLVPELADTLTLTKVGIQGPWFILSSLYEKGVQPVSASDISKALLVASSFGEEWAFTMTMALLTLKKRVTGEKEIQLLAIEFKGMKRS